MTGGELVIVIAGTRGDWPGGPRTLTPREPNREPNGPHRIPGCSLPALSWGSPGFSEEDARQNCEEPRETDEHRGQGNAGRPGAAGRESRHDM